MEPVILHYEIVAEQENSYFLENSHNFRILLQKEKLPL